MKSLIGNKPVEIKLDNNYRITNDVYNWILQKKSKKSWGNLYYYLTLEGCLSDVVILVQKGSGATSFGELTDITKDTLRELKRMVKEQRGKNE